MLVERIVEVPGSDEVFRKEQRAVLTVPDRQRPDPNQFGKTLFAPLFVRRRHNSYFCGVNGEWCSQFTDELNPIVQSSVPSDHGAGPRKMQLHFRMRFPRSAEGAIRKLYAGLRIGLLAASTVARKR